MRTAIAPVAGMDLAVPERLLMATGDVLPGWLRQETLGSPTVSSYHALGVWEFRAGRGYYELEHHPAFCGAFSDHIELAVRVIDAQVYAAVRPGATRLPGAAVLAVIRAIDAATEGLLRRALVDQLHASAAGQGDGIRTISVHRTRQLAAQLCDEASRGR